MSQRAHSPSPPSTTRKIRIHSLFLHTWLPWLLPKVNYVYRTGPLTSSMSALMELETKPALTSHTQTSQPTASSTTQTKKTLNPLYQWFHVLIPPFNHLVECMQQFPSQTMSKLTAPLSPPSPKSGIPSITMKNMSATLKRSFESLEPCNTKARPAKMTRWQLLLHDSTKSGDWTWNLPLAHHLPLTSPM